MIDKYCEIQILKLQLQLQVIYCISYSATPPWLVTRPVIALQIGESRSERIRLFFVCFCVSLFHFLFASTFAYLYTTLFGYDQARKTYSFYNMTYIIENSLPYILMLAISRDVRARWWGNCKEIWRKQSNNSVLPFST
jgi:hypothetical protein